MSLFLAAVVSFSLNPLVVRRANPPAVADCAAAPATAVRTDPISDLRDALRRNDRPAFDAALAGARASGSRSLGVWEDIARVWDAQFDSPFFAADSPAHAAASKYSGYEAAVRSEVLVDDTGRRFYPAAESREFLARATGSGTARAARRVPTKIRTDDDPAKPLPRVAAARRDTTPRRAPSRRVSSSRRRAAPTPPPPAAAPATDTVANEVVDPPPAVATATTTPPPSPPPAVATAPTPTSEPPVAPAPAPTPRRNLMVPLLVILVGIGMLILLFRTKS
jgi:hypothetical protein